MPRLCDFGKGLGRRVSQRRRCPKSHAERQQDTCYVCHAAHSMHYAVSWTPRSSLVAVILPCLRMCRYTSSAMTPALLPDLLLLLLPPPPPQGLVRSGALPHVAPRDLTELLLLHEALGSPLQGEAAGPVVQVGANQVWPGEYQ